MSEAKVIYEDFPLDDIGRYKSEPGTKRITVTLVGDYAIYDMFTLTEPNDPNQKRYEVKREVVGVIAAGWNTGALIRAGAMWYQFGDNPKALLDEWCSKDV